MEHPVIRSVPSARMNLHRCALVIAAFILSSRVAALQAPKSGLHRALLHRDRFRRPSDAPLPATDVTSSLSNSTKSRNVNSNCFPALGYVPPSVGSAWDTPNIPLDEWRCNIETERGFLGFSYEWAIFSDGGSDC